MTMENDETEPTRRPSFCCHSLSFCSGILSPLSHCYLASQDVCLTVDMSRSGTSTPGAGPSSQPLLDLYRPLASAIQVCATAAV